MESREKEENKYTIEYIKQLLFNLGCDVQDNTTVSNDGYLKLALEACEELNSVLGSRSFDEGE